MTTLLTLLAATVAAVVLALACVGALVLWFYRMGEDV